MKKILLMTLIGTLIVCFIAGCTLNPDKKQANSPTKNSAETSKADSEIYPELVIYNGGSYLVTSYDSKLITQEMIGEKIGLSSAFIDFKGKVDESLLNKELANSIDEKAVFYKMKIYNDKFRILAEVNGSYYICENIQISKDVILEYKGFIEKATINNNSMTKEYKKIEKDNVLKLIDVFEKTIKAELSDKEYENIAQAQGEGKSYLLKILFEDGTSTKFIIIPELNLVSIGQEYYTSDSLTKDIAFIFYGLPQEKEEIVN